jgi:phospholipase C
MNTPSPDSGEEFPHVNTQLFGILDEENRFKLQAENSFNEPRGGEPPTMDGFLADYISMLTVELGRQPTVEEYSQIMTGYTPAQMPVMSAIARALPRLITGSVTCRRAPIPTAPSFTLGRHRAMW